MIEVRLEIPADQAGCVTWIQSQTDPGVVADALHLCETAFNALRRGVCDTEAERLVQLHNEQIKSLQTELQKERDRCSALVNELRQAADASLASERERHRGVVETLQRQLKDSTEAHQRIQNHFLEERCSHSSALESEIQRLRERLQVDTTELKLQQAAELNGMKEDYERKLLARETSASKTHSALQERLNEERSQLAAEHKQVTESLQQERQQLMEQLCRERSDRQRCIDAASKELQARIEKDAEHRVELLQEEVSTLVGKLKSLQGCEALAKEEARKQYLECIAIKDAAHQQSLEEMKQRLDQQEKHHEHILSTREDARNKDIEWLKNELQKRTEALDSALTAKDNAVAEFSRRVESLAAENREMISNLSGTSTARGKVGEHLVETTFARLQLGSWQDDSANPAEGFADALWEFSHPSSPHKLSALVEVKNVAAIHSQKDVVKFHTDLQTAIANGRANAGMFFSLSARFPGTRPLHLCLMYGVPVCIASRSADDPMPASSLIEMAFHAMAEIWPMVCKQGLNTDVEQTIHAVAEHYDHQLQELERLSKRIASLSRLAASLSREVKALEKFRSDWTKDIEKLRQMYPQLCLDTQTADEEDETGEEAMDVWTSSGAVQFMEAISSFRDRGTKKRYPQKLSDLELTTDSQAFVDSLPNALEIATFRLKRQAATEANREKAEKRRRVVAEEQVHE